MRTTILAMTVVGGLMGAGVAGAQDMSPAPSPSLPVWDMNFSFGLFANDYQDEGEEDYDEMNGHSEARIDVGRYLTPHLKTEFGISWARHWNSYDYERISVPDLPNGGYAFTDIANRLTLLTPTFTYQFFDNSFVHPYVSTGVRVGLLQTHATREAQVHTENRVTYAVPAVDRESASWIVRPLVAVGCKSYFNERTFIRSELLTAFNRQGLAQFAVRAGFGFDF